MEPDWGNLDQGHHVIHDKIRPAIVHDMSYHGNRFLAKARVSRARFIVSIRQATRVRHINVRRGTYVIGGRAPIHSDLCFLGYWLKWNYCLYLVGIYLLQFDSHPCLLVYLM